MINWPFVFVIGFVLIFGGAIVIGLLLRAIDEKKASKELSFIELNIQRDQSVGAWESSATGYKKAILNRLGINDFDAAKSYVSGLSDLYESNNKSVDVTGLLKGAELSKKLLSIYFQRGWAD